MVICTRDRAVALVKTLESIWTQTRLPDELIIIDDGHLPDDIQHRLAGRCHGLGITWRYVRSRMSGLTSSRNLAADIAESEILQYLDDDVTCDAGLLSEIGRIMGDPLVVGVTATVEEPSFATLSGRLYQLGYRVAGWWRVYPRGRPTGARPRILNRPEAAVAARWLSGAAMALRRDIVREHRFDEGLAEYALGEDREMGYRLAPRFWLVRAKRARVVHRRDTGQRAGGRRLGFMTSYNYLDILRKTCRLGPGEWLVIGWGLAVLGAMHAAWAVVGSRKDHLDELRGMLEGLLAAVRVGMERKSVRVARAGGALRASVRTRPLVRQTAKPNGAILRSRDREAARLSGGRHQRMAWRPPGVRDRRVLFITNRLEPGGAERMLLSLARHLRGYGIQPFVGCLKDAGPLAEESRRHGIPVFDRLLRFKLDGAVLLRLQRISMDNRIDIIVAAHSGGDRMFWSTLAGRLLGVPVVVWSHWFPRSGERHFERVNRLLYRWVDSYVALGEKHRLALIRHEHLPAGRIAVIPNAIEIDQFVNAARRSEARRRLGLADHQVAIAIIANLRREKRHDVFIQAARKLSADDGDLRFFIIGDGPHRDAVWAAAAASGLDHEVLRLLGERDDVAALLPGIDISCLCSEQECYSVTMLEAAAAGCAFIGPLAGCMTEFIEHRRTGLLIRPADVDSLADAMGELAGDRGLRRRMVDAARAKVTIGYDIDEMVRRFADLFTWL